MKYLLAMEPQRRTVPLASFIIRACAALSVSRHTHAYDELLPQRPLPPLAFTLSCYAHALSASLGHDSTALRNATRAIDQLAAADNDDAARLQHALEQRRDDFKFDRVPLLSACHSLQILSNYCFVDRDCDRVVDRLRRATCATFAALQFADRLRRGRVAVRTLDSGGAVPLSMHGYRTLFGHVRVPSAAATTFGGDEVRAAHDVTLRFLANAHAHLTFGDRELQRRRRHAKQRNAAQHIVVVCGAGHYYSVPVVDARGNTLTLRGVRAQLRQVLAHSVAEAPDGETPPVAALTALERHRWAEARATHLESNARNAAALAEVESALFVLHLDDTVPADCGAAVHAALSGGAHHAQRLWFDKCFQLIVFADGTTCANVERACVAPTVFEHFWACLLRDAGTARYWRQQ